jgi:Serine/threonine protein kinase
MAPIPNETIIINDVENQRTQREASQLTSSRIRRCDRTSQLGGVLATLSLNENKQPDNIQDLTSPVGVKLKHANPYKTPIVESSHREFAVPSQLDILCKGEEDPMMSPLETPSPLAKSKSVYSTDHSIVSYSSNTPISNHSKESNTARITVKDNTPEHSSSPDGSSESKSGTYTSSSETLSEYTNDLIGVGLHSSTTSDEDYNEEDEEDEGSDEESGSDEGDSDLNDSCFVSEEFVPYGRSIKTDGSDASSCNDEDEDQKGSNTSYDQVANVAHDVSFSTDIVEAVVIDHDDEGLHDSSCNVEVEIINDNDDNDDDGSTGEKADNENGQDDASDLNSDEKLSSQDSKESFSKRSFSDFMDMHRSQLMTSTTGSSNKAMIRKGKWNLGSRIGQGSFGVVHVGMNTITGNLIAVKSMNIPTSSSDDRSCNALLEDLRREIDLMKSFNHPNIVRYLGCEFDEAKQVLHIFQEWVSGGSVTSLLSKFGPFPIPVIRSYLQQVLIGLKYLHEHNILHRDIKGGNILVNNDGVVKLADFGASKSFHVDHDGVMLDVEDAMSQMTMRGTPYFMAPEVFEENYGRKADIWSFGCVAYQMLTSNPPWRGLGFQSPMKLFLYISKNPGPPPMHGAKSTTDRDDDTNHNESWISNSLSNLLEQCFERDPSNRPSTQSLLEHPFFTQIELNESILWEEEESIPPVDSVVNNDQQKKTATTTSPLSPFSPLRLADWKRSRVGNSYEAIKENPEWPSWARRENDAPAK